MAELVRVEIKFKNAALFNALAAKYPGTKRSPLDVDRACENLRVSISGLYGLLSLQITPWNKKGKPTPSAELISRAVGVDCETLFPLRLYSGVLPRTLVRELDASRFISFASARHQHLLPSISIDTTLDRIELRERLGRALQALMPREKEVLRLRFGLDDGCERTLEEIGCSFGMSRERVRQIEAKALRKLRHPTRAKLLQDAGATEF